MLCVHACAVLAYLWMLQEATTLPSTDHIALVDLLQLFLQLILTAMTMAWLLWILHVPIT